jgi:LuxR family transcriptional regulator, maltose regulon positive regulatory protein
MDPDIDITLDVLTTKLFMPRLRSQSVARQRLIARLDAALECRLTLVCAPAGYGKTTLLSAWAGCLRGERVAWLSLDKEDNEPLTFWRYLLTASGISELPTLASQAAQDRIIRLMVTRLLNEVSSRQVHSVLLLDDYHLIPNPAIHVEMAFLLDHLPPNMHLVLATRSEPPLPLARLRLRQQLVELRMADLCFTFDEVAEFI